MRARRQAPPPRPRTVVALALLNLLVWALVAWSAAVWLGG